MEQTAIAQPLDEYLTQVVHTLYAAVNRGFRNAAEHPDVAQATVKDCEEMLDVIMEGNVQEWIGTAA